MAEPQSLGEGRVSLSELMAAGPGCVLEPGVRIIGPAWVRLGAGVYVGHDCFLRAYPEGHLIIGDGCWLGPGSFINSFGSVVLGRRVGVGPGVKILSSVHAGVNDPTGAAILDTPLRASVVRVSDGADIGAGAVLLPGAVIGERAQVGAGAVVSGAIRAGAVVAGVPARPVAGS